MQTRKHGGARRGARRKPKLPGKIELSAVREEARASTPADVLDRLLSASGLGDLRAMAAVRLLYFRAEQRLLRALAVRGARPRKAEREMTDVQRKLERPASPAEIDLAAARPYRAVTSCASGDHDWSTEARLFGSGRERPQDRQFLAAVADALDPKGARLRREERLNLAIIDAARLLRRETVSRTAKDVDHAVRRFLSDVWPRQCDLAEPPPGATAIRAALWRIAKESNGDGRAWRKIVDIIEIYN